MTRFKMILFAGLASLALAGTASAAASAHEFLINGAAFSGTKTIASSGGVFTLEAGIKLECQKEKDTGTITGGSPGKDATAVTFEECTIKGEKLATEKCEVAGKGNANGTIAVSSNTELFENKAKEVFDAFKPTSGTTFVTIVVKNKSGCLVPAGEYPVEGETCSSLGPEAVEAEIGFSKATSEKCEKVLKLKGVAATFTGTSKEHLTETAEVGKKIGHV